MAIDYTASMQRANDIYDSANEMNSEIIRLENLLAQIKGEWYGPASDAFQQQLAKVLTDMRNTRQSMYNLSSKIKTMVSQANG